MRRPNKRIASILNKLYELFPAGFHHLDALQAGVVKNTRCWCSLQYRAGTLRRLHEGRYAVVPEVIGKSDPVGNAALLIQQALSLATPDQLISALRKHLK